MGSITKAPTIPPAPARLPYLHVDSYSNTLPPHAFTPEYHHKAHKRGFIRHALAGAALGLFAILMIRPVCLWMVTAGAWLEAVLK